MSLLTAGDLTPPEGHVEQILAWLCGTREGEGDSNTGAFRGSLWRRLLQARVSPQQMPMGNGAP